MTTQRVINAVFIEHPGLESKQRFLRRNTIFNLKNLRFLSFSNLLTAKMLHRQNVITDI
ncbi:MAG: hypothetical protein AAGC95_13480 [Pseudomonadota bacterium]